MTTNERLQKIKTKCQELLEIAEKRTPGAWSADVEDGSYFVYQPENRSGVACEINRNNAPFIASCAGPAEAGWRATIAAIESAQAFEVEWIGHYTLRDAILAAWPEELL